ncbi:VOC family protein [Enterococcus sp. BWR-S5]|uniref:VOC family protein n=1 Tax=Enterococcus sp. BWR-S5 TaxID=2787714 RepID=UPI00192157D2|nr:VOC family protein [Enterococcus sp. BWR-S5]MBL1223588.1 VOC family protein [Enterococcus sp. BWR-S5]
MTPFIHHVSLLTRHSEENRAFYIELLGLRVVKHTVNQDNHRMIHDYYGNYYGAPGSVITFFIVPMLGHRYDNNHFLSTIGLKIPAGSLSFWKNRLANASVDYQEQEQELSFFDKDHVEIHLVEVNQAISDATLQVANDIPANKQILGLLSTEFHVSEPKKTIDFFEQLLGWKSESNRITLNETDFVNVVKTSSQEPMRMGRGSMDHVAFAMADDTALDALYEKAKHQGWQIEKIINRGYFRSLYIREPGGNRVEFATVAPGFTIDEPLEELGEHLALPPFLENQRVEIEKHLYEEK